MDILDEILNTSTENQFSQLSRRTFIRLSGFAGLTIGLVTPSMASAKAAKKEDRNINHYVNIGTDGVVTIYSPNPEVGQGVKTSLPMILAEELDVDWDQVSCQLSDVDSARYGRQVAGGSGSILFRWPEMRAQGATARQMLINAAAKEWGVTPKSITTESGQLFHKRSGKKASYGEMASKAAMQPVPDESSLVYKNPKNYKILGKRVSSVDNETIVTGKPIFGIDVHRPDMVYATYVRSPILGGKVKSANIDKIKAVPGVIDAFVVKGNVAINYFNFDKVNYCDGVVIVGKNTWCTFKARKALNIEWDLAEASAVNSEDVNTQALKLLKDEGQNLDAKGDVDSALKSAEHTLESIYQTDYVSHAQLEPQNCTVDYRGGQFAELWIPTQVPDGAQKIAQEIFGLTKEQVKVHQIRGGGGFGRRLANDYVVQASIIAKRIKRPVKLQWTREDDMVSDFYRPAAWYKLKGGLDKKGILQAWNTHVVSTSVDGKNSDRSAGLFATGYPKHFVSHYREQESRVTSAIPSGPVRAPRSNTFAFAEQSFVHELAVKAGRDHLEFLIETMGKPVWVDPGNLRKINTERAIATIQKVAENAKWGSKRPANRSLGLSFYFSHASHVAEVAEVSVDKPGEIRIHNVWMVADVGQVINLSGLEGQASGSIIDGISTMAGQKITYKKGKAEQSNYHQYPLLRTFQRPEVHMEFIRTGDYAPCGFGEPALPPIAAAVCNAVYSLTGKRIRRLPISHEGFTFV